MFAKTLYWNDLNVETTVYIKRNHTSFTKLKKTSCFTNVVNFENISQAVGLSIQNEDGEQYPRHYLGSANKNVRRWFSPSDSYIQIEHIQQPLACGKDSQLGLLYSTPNDTNLNFYIMVSYKLNILDLIIQVEPMFTNKTGARALFT